MRGGAASIASSVDEDSGFAHQVDHVISRKHGGSSTSENLAYACVICNRYKGSDVASIEPDGEEYMLNE